MDEDIHVKRSPTKTELEDIEQQSREIKDLLSKVQGLGYTFTVWRMAPRWCEGWLEEMDADPEVGIDINYLCQTWGGTRIHLKLHDSSGKFRGGVTINLKSWKPRVLGKVIHQHDALMDWQPKESNIPGRNSKSKDFGQDPRYNPYQAAPPPPPPENTLIKDLMGMLFEQQKQMFKNQSKQSTGTPEASGDPIASLMGSLKAFKEMKKVLDTGEAVVASAPDDSNQMFSAISGMVKMFMEGKHKEPNVPQLPVPPQIRNDAGLGVLPPGGQTATPRPKPMDPMALPGYLAKLGPEVLTNIMSATFARMEPGDQQKMMSEFGSGLDFEDGVEYEDEEIEGTDEEIANDEDGNTVASYDPHPDPGRTIRPNENDDPGDRERNHPGFPIPTNQE